MIEIDALNKRFGKLQALKDVSLSFSQGECIALIGPNGCGKTTLIKCILGMVIPTSGTIRFDGKPVTRDHTYRSRIGYMPQIGRYPDNMRIGQVVEMIRNIRRSPRSTDEELLRAFRLEEMYDKRMRTLSGGTTQKVSASLAFLFNPDVLILDEPTAGLDPIAADILKDKIASERRNGKLIIITSHLLAELDELISRVVFMQDGLVKFHKDIDTLRGETGESRISRAIAKIMKGHSNG